MQLQTCQINVVELISKQNEKQLKVKGKRSTGLPFSTVDALSKTAVSQSNNCSFACSFNYSSPSDIKSANC